MGFVKLREAEPMTRRTAALICFAAASAGWALTIAAAYWLVTL